MVELVKQAIPVKRTLLARSFTNVVRCLKDERSQIRWQLKKLDGSLNADTGATLARLYNKIDDVDKEYLLVKVARRLKYHILLSTHSYETEFEKAVKLMDFVHLICTDQKSTYSQDRSNPNFSSAFRLFGQMAQVILRPNSERPDDRYIAHPKLIAVALKTALALDNGKEEELCSLLDKWIAASDFKSTVPEIVFAAEFKSAAINYLHTGVIPFGSFLRSSFGMDIITEEISRVESPYSKTLLGLLYAEPELSLRMILSRWIGNGVTIGYALDIAANSSTLTDEQKISVFRRAAECEGGYSHLMDYIQSPKTQKLVMDAVLGLKSSEEFFSAALEQSIDKEGFQTLLRELMAIRAIEQQRAGCKPKSMDWHVLTVLLSRLKEGTLKIIFPTPEGSQSDE